jgi:hypothetical protein
MASFQNTFRNTHGIDNSSPRDYISSYNNIGSGVSSISNVVCKLFWGYTPDSSPTSSSKHISRASSSSYLDFDSLGASCVGNESNCDLRN